MTNAPDSVLIGLWVLLTLLNSFYAESQPNRRTLPAQHLAKGYCSSKGVLRDTRHTPLLERILYFRPFTVDSSGLFLYGLIRPQFRCDV